MTTPAQAKLRIGDVHYGISALLALAAVPLLRRLGLPLNFDWAKLLSAYWLVLAAQSILVAALLCLVGFPAQESFRPMVQRWRKNKVLIIFWLAYFLILLWALAWVKALILTVDTIAVLEFRERLKEHGLWKKTLLAVVVPAAYLFAGFLLVFAYNDIILSTRFYGAVDQAFSAMDKWLLHGGSVPSLCHWAVHVLPLRFFRFLEFIYFGMFAQIGAALLLCSLYFGKNRGLRFVGTILTAYYLALVLFYLWPSQGPYYLCPIHFSDFPNTLQVYATQKNSIVKSQALWNHLPIGHISTDYFIAFPCMHIAQPLIVLWFLKPWKRMVIALAAYDVVLLASIVLLEWHYVVDILGGVLVAVGAIAVVDGHEFWMWTKSQSKPEAAEGASSA